MTISKYWGEERHSDAVYAVYLKKVRYYPPQGYEGFPHYRPIDPDNYFLAQDANDQLQWETIRERVIKAGTLDKLVESLITTDDKMDSRHFNVFFATYRAFGRSGDVLTCLITWFERLENDECSSRSSLTIQSTIRSIVISWMETYPEDFYDHTDYKFPLLTAVIEFAKKNSLTDLKHRARKLREKYRRVAEDGGLATQLPSIQQYTYTLDYDPNDMIYAKERAQMFDISKDNCVQIAEQLTVWDSILFRELRPYQCQGTIWGKRKKDPNNVYTVRATIDQFNAVAQRVLTSIVLPDCRPEFRARIIEKWIEIAKELKALKNYSSLKAVISSLQSEPVFRIKSAWNCVSKGSNMVFKELTTMFENEDTSSDERSRDLIDSDGSVGKGPKKIQKCRRTKSDVNLSDSQCSVPYLGSFLTDLMMLDQALPNHDESGLINFEKRRKEFEIMAKIRLHQSAARSNLPMDHAFCAWFYYLPTMNENDCFQRSLEVEPGPKNLTPDLRRNRNNHSATSNGTKMNSITRMFGYLADEFTTNLKGSSLLNGQFSNDSGINTEESWANSSSSNQNTSQTEQPSAIAMALISRGKMLATPGIPCGVSTPLVPWIINSQSPSEFNPRNMQFSPHHPVQRSDPTSNGRRSDSLPRSSHLKTSGASASSDSPCPTPQDSGSFSKQGSFQNSNLNRRMPGHQSTSSHTSSSSIASSISARPQTSSCTSPGSNTSTIFSNGVPPSSNSINFHLARVGLDDALQSDNSGPMYKCIKVENGDRMVNLIERALEKHMLDMKDKNDYCLIQWEDWALSRKTLFPLLSEKLNWLMRQCPPPGKRSFNQHPFQLLPDGGEFRLPDHCNPFYAVAPDPQSPMLNFVLRRQDERTVLAPSAKKLNRQKRSNLTKWNSGYL